MATFQPPSDFWNTITNNNSGTEIGNEGGAVNGAFRFTNVNIPQGSIIQQAELGFYVGAKGSGSGNLKYKVWGIDEDNTGSFDSSPMGRTKTDAVHTEEENNWGGVTYVQHDVASIVQEIVNRGSWSSGNAMGFILEDNGSPSEVWIYDSPAGTSSRLVITISSPSASPSRSLSPSASVSQSASISPSASQSPSGSLSPSPGAATFVLKVAKSGINALESSNPNDFIFHSDYNTFKIIDEDIYSNSLAAGVTTSFTIAHGLSYIPLVHGFCKIDDNANVILPNDTLYSPTGSDADVFRFNYIESDATNITFNLTNFDSSNHDFSIKYYIFEVPL